MRRLAALALLLLPALSSRGAVAGPEDTAPGCRHWAVLLPEDAGQLRIYDGIRKGLEVAQLERLCLKDLADTEEAFKAFVAEHAALPEPLPLVFLIGRRAGDRMLAARFQGPGVYVSTEWTGAGTPLRTEPSLPPGVARVRGDLPAETLGQVVRDSHSGVLPFVMTPASRRGSPFEPEREHPELSRLLSRTQLNSLLFGGRGGGGGKPVLDLWLHLPVGLGASNAGTPGDDHSVPMLSDDIGRYGSGVPFVLCPDHERLGRTAAEAGRRLWRGEPVTQALVVRGAQVLVDLDACDAQGIRAPLTFLAGVDGIKGRRAPAAAPGTTR